MQMQEEMYPILIRNSKKWHGIQIKVVNGILSAVINSKFLV